MRVTNLSLPYSNPLAGAYLEDFTRVASLFEYNPKDQQSYQKRCQYLDENYHHRAGLVGALTRFNEEIGCSDATRANLERLARHDAVVVITGQQAGILTGPLYTIYKAITTVQLAQSLSSRLERPVVPVFWVAGEDHDFLEINHLYLQGTDHQVTKIQLNQESPGRVAAGHLPVTEAVDELLAELDRSTAANQWQQETLDVLRDLAYKSNSLAQWFARIMQWLFKDLGLILADPLDHELKQLAGTTFRTALENLDRIEEALAQSRETVVSLGYIPQVADQPGHTNLFYFQEGALPQRRPIFSNESVFQTRAGDLQWTLEQLLELADQQPAKLSPNVVLRPMVQDALFPTLTYVAGPGEISYYALYKGVYKIFGREMPIIYPRANVTLIEPPIARSMERYGISEELVFTGLNDRMQELLAEADQLGITQLFDQIKKEFSPRYEELIGKLATLDHNLEKLGHENHERILAQMDFLEGKAMQKHRQQQEGIIKNFTKIKSAILPRDTWQERKYNIIPYLFKYGPDLVKQMSQATLAPGGIHNFIYL